MLHIGSSRVFDKRTGMFILIKILANTPTSTSLLGSVYLEQYVYLFLQIFPPVRLIGPVHLLEAV